MFACGNLPDPAKAPHEKQDLVADESCLSSASVPFQHSNAQLVPSILNQGQLGSCTANAVAQCLRADTIRQLLAAGKTIEEAYNMAELASRLFLYYLARSTHGMASLDSGTWLRAVFQIINKFGFPAEDAWEYDPDPGPGAKAFRLPAHTAFQAAFDRRAEAKENALVEYRRIYDTGYERVEAVKRAILAGHLVCFGTDVSKRFTRGDFDGGNPIKPPVGEEFGGGHAMAWDGFSGDDLDTVNSWGNGFGMNGRCRMSADYVAWEKTRDVWVVKRAPLLLEAA